MQTKLYAAPALLVLSLSGSAAFAGDVVVPLAVNQVTTGLTTATRVTVSNPTTAQQRVTATFFPADTNGTTSGVPSPALVLNPGATTVLTSVAPSGASGLLEISGPAEIVIDARVENRNANSALLGAIDTPVVSQADTFAGGATAHLLALDRVAGGGAVTTLYLFNFDSAVTSCAVKAFKSNGDQIASTAIVSVKPRSRRDFTDALNILGQSNITDTRFEASCDKRFYVAALSARPDGSFLNWIAPAAAPATDLLGTSGGGGTPPPSSGNDVVFSVSGQFLNATNGNSSRSYQLPVKPGVPYKKAVIEFDLFIRNFPVGVFTSVTGLRRPNPQRAARVLYYGLQIVNKNSKTNLDLGIQDVLVKELGPWTERHTYHLRFTYDVVARVVRLEVFENGNKLQDLSGEAQHLDLSATNQPLVVDFGQDGIADGAYYPPIGWQYSNLKAVLTAQ